MLFGHSGSGKSLTLRAIAGLMKPDAGRIEIEGQAVFDATSGLDVPPERRGVGLVVQSYALIPHMTVADNVAFGLHDHPKRNRPPRVEPLLKVLAIEELAHRKPAQISGGQAQRVALARALAPEPRLLLLDEPFSALDTAIRVTLRRELTRLKRELGLTIVFVTHDLREAYNLADRIAVFDAGAVLQVGSRDEVFDRPASARVAALTEVRNIWEGTVTATDANQVSIETPRFNLRAHHPGAAVGDRVVACIRPERVILHRPDRPIPDAAGTTVLQGELMDEVAHGASHTLFFAVGDPRPSPDVEVDLPARPYDVLGIADGRRWQLELPTDSLHVMPDR